MDNIIAFVDNVGRVIIGTKVNETDTELKIKDPAIVNVQVNQQNGQMSVQLLPFVFREFLSTAKRESGVEWKFNTSSIVTSDDIELDDAIISQYKGIHAAPVGNTAPPVDKESDVEVVKLFDDED